MPRPDLNLEAGSGSHSQQKAAIMVKFEKVLLKEKPDIVIVAGDVNSTLACALVAKKLHIKVGHIESGLRSFDMRMPEEINRKLTDAISDYLFTPSPEADANLIKEGIKKDKIHFVGNIMIDTLLRCQRMAKTKDAFKKLKLGKGEYALLTLHRPENVDSKANFSRAIRALKKVSKTIPILFPIHPRTQKKIKEFKLEKHFKQSKNHNKEGIILIPPLGYLGFVNLMINSRFVLTDSGGIQEETTMLRIPCLTMRSNTERPVTITSGSNCLVGIDEKKITKGVNRILNGDKKTYKIPKYWDGKTAPRIVSVLKKCLA
jgi:UDP-N-acetylglucosamine 2-epimerase (non-hydrolysing)